MKKIFLALMALAVVAACSSKQKQDWGITKQAPNEFMVTSRPPLTLPPDYDLRPVNDTMKVDSGADKSKLSSNEKALLQKVNQQNPEALPDDDEQTAETNHAAIDKELGNIKSAGK